MAAANRLKYGYTWLKYVTVTFIQTAEQLLNRSLGLVSRVLLQIRILRQLILRDREQSAGW
jgi:hypothetical protein